MAETASILSPGQDGADPRPRRRLLAGRLDHRRPAARLEGRAPGRDRRDVRQHDRRGEGRDRLLRDLLERGRRWSSTSSASTATDTEILFGPDMFLGAYVEKRDGRADARLGRRVPRARRHPPARHHRDARRAPGRGLPDPSRVRLLDLGDGVRRGRRRGRRGRAHALDRRDDALRARARRPARRRSSPPRPGCCTRCSMARPDIDFVAANEAAACRYMKMITLPKLRDALRDLAPVVKVPEAIAERARRADRADGRDRLDRARSRRGR